VPSSAQERLAALGITTLQELRDVWIYGNRQLLVDYLGDSPVRFAAFRPEGGFAHGRRAGGAARGPGDVVNLLAAGNPPPLVKMPTGLGLTAAQRQRRAESPSPVATRTDGRGKTVVSKVRRFPPVRDQGHRGTCVAFAVVAYLEYHLYDASSKTKHHSEQFVFWACKQLDGEPNKDHTYLEPAREVLASQGACLAKTWKYKPYPTATVDQGPPPVRAVAEARSYTWKETRDLSDNMVDGLRASLDQCKPVVLGLYTFPSWFLPAVRESGDIIMPVPGEAPDEGHAVCVVGYELNGRVPGGGAFLFRNSWGRAWPQRPREPSLAGYGTLPFEYVRLYGLVAFG
jgi:hypothetical protein